jgi:mono/diheme cytochrome c family protein
MQAPDVPLPASAAATDPEAVERGGYLVRGPAHCAQCHSGTDRDHPEQVKTEPLHGGLAFEMGPLGSLYSRNLTPDPTTGIGRRSDGEIARVLKTGVLPEGQISVFMLLSAAKLSDEDIADVIAYLRAQAPVENAVPDMQFTILGKVIVKYAFPELHPRDEQVHGVPMSLEPSVERGEYLAENVMLCTTCHTDYDQATFQPIGPKGGGCSIAEPSHGEDSDMEYCPPNLTSSPTGITGKLDEDAFVARIETGRIHKTSIMPWEGFQNTAEVDLRSVYRYLKSLPPVDRDTGPPYRPVGWTPEG